MPSLRRPTSLLDVAKIYFADISVLIYMAAAIAALTYAYLNYTFSHGVLLSIAFVAAGWLLYLIQEYIAHVWIFHMPAPKNQFLYRLLYRLHMGHHDTPKRIDILITPFWFTLPVLLLNVFAFNFLVNDPVAVILLTFGLIIGYLEFEWFHLLVHTPYQVKNKWLKFIKHRHMAHHYTTEKKWFTVTPIGSILDDVFNTGGNVEDAEPSNNPQNGDLTSDDPRVVSARDHYSKNTNGTVYVSQIWIDGI